MIRNSLVVKVKGSVIIFALYLVVQAPCAARQMVDFSECVIVTSAEGGRLERKAAAVLEEEIRKRTSIEPRRAYDWPGDNRPVIAVGLQSRMKEFAGPLLSEVGGVEIPGKEGFCLVVKAAPRKAVVIVGKDERGVLYGVGRLLRKMHLSDKLILVPEDLRIITAPKYPLRGHQLGYRPKTNAYDAWSVEQFEQYIRELAFFGVNSIEIMPPRTDDDRTSRHMKVPAMEMMMRLSEIIDSYGMDVWIWYPNMGKGYRSEEVIREELAEREEIFKRLKRIDVVFVPGGDPGHLHPDVLFPWLEKVAEVLTKYHPWATIWVSPQAMQPTREWLGSFYDYVNQKPKWLGGVVFSPWVKTPLPQMRQIVDRSVPIRRYPDITHNVACQYPVMNWDLAFALTLHRECFNPRPRAMKTIHNALDEYSCGALTYSEGINDDVNKFVWSDQDWAPGTDVIETLKDYSRLFIDPDFCGDIAQGIMAQESNWEGPLAANAQVEVTFRQWRRLEKEVPERVNNNYRFQMCLMRAYYDAYVRRRLVYETELEMRATDVLRSAGQSGALEAIERAGEILRKAKSEPVAADYKKRCEQLADSLYEKIGSQTTVGKHGASHRTRGAFMDGIDEPLNNAAWLYSQFEDIRKTESEAERLEAIDRVINRTNPGPGGFYDNMGAVGSEKRILSTIAWEDDPGTLLSPRIAFYYIVDRSGDRCIPLAWKNQVGTIYETPLRLFYEDLDPEAAYTVRVAYTGRRGDKVQLVADDIYPIHDLIETRKPPIREFLIPKEATADGRVVLTWTCGEGERGSQVSEIWLIRNKAK